MKSTQILIRSAFIAATALSAPAFAGDASDTWVAYSEARNLPVQPSPSKPYVSPMSLLVEMSISEGDANRAEIARRILESYARRGIVHADGSGEGNGRNEAKTVACDIDFLSKLAQSEGSRPGDEVGCSRN
jgi:hypothetical protein